jgi:hypothetical protein
MYAPPPILPMSLSCVPSSKSISSPLGGSDMKSSSESMAFKDGEPCSVMGVEGPCARSVDVLRVLGGSCLDASVTHSSTFRFLD